MCIPIAARVNSECRESSNADADPSEDFARQGRERAVLVPEPCVTYAPGAGHQLCHTTSLERPHLFTAQRWACIGWSARVETHQCVRCNDYMSVDVLSVVTTEFCAETK